MLFGSPHEHQHYALARQLVLDLLIGMQHIRPLILYITGDQQGAKPLLD